MALINKLENIKLEKNTPHKTVDCSYTIIEESGKKFLQVDTYGSSTRQIKNKKSQSLRFSPDAIKQLKTILENF